MYSVRYDAAERILHLRLEGFWTMATLARFTADLLLQTAKLKLNRVAYAVLSDSSAFAIQSPAVSQGFERIMARGTGSHRGPTAIVVAGRLNKLQAERTLKGDRVRVFLTEADARAWLAIEMAATPA